MSKRILQLAGRMENELTAIKQGKHEAFIQLYNELHVKVFRFFLKRVFLHDTARELTQQCFIRLWEFRHTLSDSHPLEKQVFIIARSILINHIHKATTEKRLKSIHTRSLGKDGFVPDSSASLEISGEVNAAIETLPPVRKKIVILKALHGFSNKEVAEQMDISVKTVEDHITKAFRQMRQVVGHLFFF